MSWSVSASSQTSLCHFQSRTSSDAEMCIRRHTDSKAGGQVGIFGNISCEPFLIISAVLTGNEWNRVWEGLHLTPSLTGTFPIHCLHTKIKCYLNGTRMPLGYPLGGWPQWHQTPVYLWPSGLAAGGIPPQSFSSATIQTTKCRQ